MILNDTIVPIISNVGFPIAIALYVLFRLEKVVKQNTEVIQQLVLEIRAGNKNGA